MIRKLRKAGAMMMVGAMAVSTAATTVPYNVLTAEAAENETKEVKVTFKDLVEAGGYQFTKEIDETTGAITLNYEQQYAEVMYKIPESIKPYQVKKIVVDLADGTGISLKTRSASAEIEVAYGVTEIDVTNTKSFENFGIMNSVAGASTVKINSVTFVVDESIEEPEDDAAAVKKEDYSFKDLEVALQGAGTTGGTVEVDAATGKVTVTMTRQYGQVFFRLPEELDKMIVTNIVLNVTEGSGSSGIAPKLLTEADFNTDNRGGDVGVAYGSNSLDAKSDALGKDARYIGIMTTSDCSADKPVVMTFDSVTISSKSAEKVVKNNMMENFNGSFEGAEASGKLYYWNDGTWQQNGVKAIAYSAEDKAPSKKVGDKYLKVTDQSTDTLKEDGSNADAVLPTVLMNANVGIKAGNTYEFTYYAKLAAETAVEKPMVDLKVQTHDGEWKNSGFSTVTYDEEFTLTNEWQKISGTFSIPEDVASAASKISLQGSDGIDFCVDDLQIGHKVVPHVEKDIPDFYQEIAKQGIKYSGVAVPSSALEDELRMQLVFKHFNSLTCENEMKPESILGSSAPGVSTLDELADKLNFAQGDAVAAAVAKYNEDNDASVKMRGHVFVWHSQTPTWWFREDFKSDGAYVSKEEMNKRIDWYIKQVATHYDTKFPGLIYAWDVVNEQANDAGGIRMGTDWAAVYGGSDEYIMQAFKSADQYLDKNTILFYNDYNECTPTKCAQICEFLTNIRKVISSDRKLGAGMQGHHDMASPSNKVIEDAMRNYAAVADVVHITELDIKSSVGFDGVDLDTEFTKQAYRYKAIYDIAKKINAEGKGQVECITIWGTHDAVSWLKTSNNVGGSADGKTPQFPLLFDDNFVAKPAYYALIGDMDKVQPLIKSVEAIETDKFDIANSYEDEDEKMTIVPVWEEGKVKIQVTVKDAEVTEGDSVTLVIDPKNSKKENATVISETKAATEAEDGAYTVVFEQDIEGLQALDTIGFDVIVKDGDDTVVYNDKSMKLDENGKNVNGSKYFAEMVVKPLLKIKKGTAAVDGNPADWEEISATELKIKSQKPKAAATAKVAWDEQNLYVLMDVEDEDMDVTAADDYQQDSMELFIDEGNEKGGSYDDNDKQYRVNYENHQSFNGKECKAEYIKSATAIKEDGSGYYIEAAIKWTELSPKVADLIGIDLQINDGSEGSRVGTINWYDKSGNGYQNPSVFGTAILEDALGESDETLVKAAEDAIDAIGEVALTEESKKAIDDAVKAYADMTVTDRLGVDVKKAALLDAAVTTYEKASAAVAAIEAIKDVKADDASEKAIKAAREAYDALTDAQKKLISEDAVKKLTDAEAAYKAAVDKKAADAAIALINAIKDVKADDASEKAIKAAKEAYDALTDDQKKLVGDDVAKKITDAETAYKKAVADKKAAEDKAKADKEKATAAEKAIAAIKNSSDKAGIEAARKAYDALTADQKKLVNPASVTALTNAEKALAAATAKPSTPSTQATTQAQTVKIAKVSGLKVTKKKVGSKTKLTIKFKKIEGCKYQIQVSTSKKFAKKSTKKLTAKTNKKTYSKNFKGKKVYVRVRAYKNVNGKPVYGAWKKSKAIKTK